MKNQVKEIANTVPLDILKTGDTFKYQEDYYLKTQENEYKNVIVVLLETGHSYTICAETLVLPVPLAFVLDNK